MGLDMYARTIPAEKLGDRQVDVNELLYSKGDFAEGVEDFGYWRKFNHLHGWMERLYYEKGGTSESFNCNTVRLTPEDIDRLEKDAIEGNLTATEGFFFGGSELYPEDLEELTAFIARSREAFKRGLAVVYDSWW